MDSCISLQRKEVMSGMIIGNDNERENLVGSLYGRRCSRSLSRLSRDEEYGW